MDDMPEFPNVAGADRLSDEEKSRIAEAAWANSDGNADMFRQLVAQHVAGDIDLFSDNPTGLGVNGRGVGDDAFSATGGETHDTRAPASSMPKGAPAVGSQPAAEDAVEAGEGVATQNADLAGQGPGDAGDVARQGRRSRRGEAEPGEH